MQVHRPKALSSHPRQIPSIEEEVVLDRDVHGCDACDPSWKDLGRKLKGAISQTGRSHMDTWMTQGHYIYDSHILHAHSYTPVLS